MYIIRLEATRNIDIHQKSKLYETVRMVKNECKYDINIYEFGELVLSPIKTYKNQNCY